MSVLFRNKSIIDVKFDEIILSKFGGRRFKKLNFKNLAIFFFVSLFLRLVPIFKKLDLLFAHTNFDCNLSATVLWFAAIAFIKNGNARRSFSTIGLSAHVTCFHKRILFDIFSAINTPSHSGRIFCFGSMGLFKSVKNNSLNPTNPVFPNFGYSSNNTLFRDGNCAFLLYMEAILMFLVLEGGGGGGVYFFESNIFFKPVDYTSLYTFFFLLFQIYYGKI